MRSCCIEVSWHWEAGDVYHDTLDSLLAVSEFVSLHCPATDDTRGLLNAQRIAKLPDKAILVNTARGALVDEQALVDAISHGKLAAAGLDCFITEPGGNPGFAAHQNIFMLFLPARNLVTDWSDRHQV